MWDVLSRKLRDVVSPILMSRLFFSNGLGTKKTPPIVINGQFQGSYRRRLFFETVSLNLKIDGWKTILLVLGKLPGRCYIYIYTI